MDFSAEGVARRKLSLADHILTQTYPLVRDPKLLLAVLQNLIDALDAAVSHALTLEVAEKRLLAMPETAETRLSAFRQAAGRYSTPTDFFSFTEALRETLREHQQSPVEFVRKEQLVICDEKYKVRTLSEEQLKGQLHQARTFIAAIEESTQKVTPHDAVLTRRD